MAFFTDLTQKIGVFGCKFYSHKNCVSVKKMTIIRYEPESSKDFVEKKEEPEPSKELERTWHASPARVTPTFPRVLARWGKNSSKRSRIISNKRLSRSGKESHQLLLLESGGTQSPLRISGAQTGLPGSTRPPNPTTRTPARPPGW